MYLEFFGLNEAPFAITPDPAFVFLSAVHRDALAHLLYGVGQGGAGGFVQLTGEVGTGKTTLCRCLLEQIPDDTQVALVLNPMMTPRELVATICEELGLDTSNCADSSKAMADLLNSHLLEQHARGRRVVVVIDEAQNLSPEALEQVRLLTNLETSKDKLLQMVLLGQPELRDLLQRQNLRQLAQRITARYHLAPLDRAETQAYVWHRMKVAGARRNPFRQSATRALYQRSGGIPRLINIIADRALAGAYARETGNVSAAMVNAAANEVQPSERAVHANRAPAMITSASIVALVAVSLVAWGPALMDRVFPSREMPVELVSLPETRPESPPDKIQDVESAVMGAVKPAVGAFSSPAASQPDAQNFDASWLRQQDRRAWQALASLWHDRAGGNSVQSACDGVAGSGYACVRETGNWSRIRLLGLPVLLVLQENDSSLLLLRGFHAEKLLIDGNESVLEVDRDFVEERWFGEYIIAWPQSPDWPDEIKRGESGTAVDIVMEMATLVEPPWHGGGVFDSRFENWLRSFQQRHGLKADGIIGPNTLIYLMAPTIAEPRLILASEEKS